VNSNWNPKQTGYWRVAATDPMWGKMPVIYPPEYEEIAKWVASNHNVVAVWHEPADSSKEASDV